MLSITLKNKETIKYRKIGHGPNIMVMIHGNICSGLNFKPILKYLPEDYTVYIPDLRGFGESSYLNKINTIEDLSNDLHEFVSKLKLESFVLLGWSAGGCVCMDFASRFANYVKSLILVESVGYKGCPMYDELGNVYKSKEDMENEPTQVKPATTCIENNDFEFMKNLWSNAIFINTKPNVEDEKEFVKASLNQRNLVDMYWALSNFNISNESNGYTCGNNKIIDIKAPVLLTYGTGDFIVSRDDIFKTSEMLNNHSEVLVLDDVGHSPFIDCPEILMKHILDFLKKYN